MDLDPAKLLLDFGAFCCGEDDPLAQIPFGTLGPLAKGIVLATYTEAQPFLQAGNCSHTMLVVNPPTEVQTNLQ